MGWQGRFNHKKGKKLYDLLPFNIRKDWKFIHAAAWRCNHTCYIRVEHKLAPKKFMLIKMDRDGNNVAVQSRWIETLDGRRISLT
jgi:hypothetical protein